MKIHSIAALIFLDSKREIVAGKGKRRSSLAWLNILQKMAREAGGWYWISTSKVQITVHRGKCLKRVFRTFKWNITSTTGLCFWLKQCYPVVLRLRKQIGFHLCWITFFFFVINNLIIINFLCLVWANEMKEDFNTLYLVGVNKEIEIRF